MRINLNGFVQAASGTYGGRHDRFKLSTLNDRSITLVKRKAAMTGDHTHYMHAWARVHWVWVDAYWRSLPRRIRAVWGMCAKRTRDTARSNLDEFRAVNLPRSMLGMATLRLPPDRATSHCTYIPREKPAVGRVRRKPSQIWLSGTEKPEPPWKPGDPLEPTPPLAPPPEEGRAFDLWDADEPNPIIPQPACFGDTCPANVIYCSDTFYCFPPVDFVPRADHSWLKWYSPPLEGGTFRSPQWESKAEIHSERVWYDNVPYETIIADHLECHTDLWWGTDIPWGSAWCIRLKYNCPPGVKLSWGYYWQPRTTPCPIGPFTLAWKTDEYGEYPWPDHIMLEPTGLAYGDVPPCPHPGSYFWEAPIISGYWQDLEVPGNWCGLSWILTTAVESSPRPDNAHGPALDNYSKLCCECAGPRAGYFWFIVTVKHKGNSYPLEYRKPAYLVTGGPFGAYFLYDPPHDRPWAPPAVQIWNEEIDWYWRDPNAFWNVAKSVAAEMAIMFVAQFLAARIMHYLNLGWVSIRAPYEFDAILRSVRESRRAAASLGTGTWRCRIFPAGWEALKRQNWLAGEATRRLRGGVPHVAPWWPKPPIPGPPL